MDDPIYEGRDLFDRAIGRKLAIAREQNGQSQRTLGAELGLFEEDVYGFETGRTPLPIHLLPELCSVLAKPLNYWIDDTGYVPSTTMMPHKNTPSNDNPKRT